MDRRLSLAALAALAAAPCAAAAQPRGARSLLFEVDLRAEQAAGRFDPARDRVVLLGAAPPLSWERGLALAPLGDGRYGLEVAFERLPAGGQGVQHKFRILRPGAAADAGWEPGRNHVADPAAERVQRRFGDEAAPAPTRLAGTVLALQVPSRHVAGPRPVWVWLPPGAEQQPLQRHPVLVLHDGQNVFDAAAAGAEWQVDEAAQQGVQSGRLRPFIVVAVASGRDRIRDLTPSAVVLDTARAGAAGAGRQGGGLAAYGRFLGEELKPFIEARFRTLAGREHWSVGGSSLGGLASLALVLDPASVFGAALVVSPSVWWDDAWLLRTVQALPATGPPGGRPRLWLDIGAREGPGAVAAVQRLRDALQSRGWTPGADLAYAEDADGTHDEASWSARVPQMLSFLFHNPENRR